MPDSTYLEIDYREVCYWKKALHFSDGTKFVLAFNSKKGVINEGSWK